MKLSDRLESVVSLVEPADAAADIGTDHGYVPVELVRRGIVSRALAMDVKRGPLLKAEENIRMAGLSDRIGTRLSDGLKKLSPGEADAAVIAGMGGELMIHILEEGRHMWESVSQWIFSPHSEIGKFRSFLLENGFAIRREAMVFEEGKYYTVLDAGWTGEKRTDARPAGLLYGEYLIHRGDPVLLQYLKDEEKKLSELFDRLSARAEDSERARESMAEIKEKLRLNREVQNEMQGDR